jgi:hypothetical protein
VQAKPSLGVELLTFTGNLTCSGVGISKNGKVHFKLGAISRKISGVLAQSRF